MTPEELAAKAKETQQRQQEGIALTEARVNQFRQDTTNLFREIEGWLSPFVKNGTASISKSKFELSDSTTRSRYQIEKMEISIIGNKISLTPEYLYGIGHCFSIDVKGISKAGLSIFKDAADDKVWHTRAPGKPGSSELNEIHLMDLIAPLVS